MRVGFPFLALPRPAPPIPRPAVWVRLVGPRGSSSRPIVGLVDTGALSTILPGRVAAEAGVRPRPGPPLLLSIGGGTVPAYRAGEVKLRILARVGGAEEESGALEIPSSAVLVSSPPFLDLALLGLHGFLDRIDELCVRAREEVVVIARG